MKVFTPEGLIAISCGARRAPQHLASQIRLVDAPDRPYAQAVKVAIYIVAMALVDMTQYKSSR